MYASQSIFLTEAYPTGTIGKFITWRGNSALNCTRKPISHDSRSDECDIGFHDIGIHKSSNEFSLNRIAKAKLNYWAKPNVLYFCEPRQCANDANPFKVSCQDQAKKTCKKEMGFMVFKIYLPEFLSKLVAKLASFVRYQCCGEMCRRQSTTEILRRNENFKLSDIKNKIFRKPVSASQL